MKIGALVFILYAQWSYCNISLVDSVIRYGAYLKYLQDIVNHIRVQKGWQTLYHLEIHRDENTRATVHDILTQNVEIKDVANIFNIIVNLANYKYVDAIQTFVELISILIEECKTPKSNDEFLYCARSLQIELKNSLSMFEHMYKALAFLTHLDIKHILNVTSSNPYTLIEEIYFIKTCISNMVLSNEFDLFDDFYEVTLHRAKTAVYIFIEFLIKIPQNISDYSIIFVTKPETVNLKLVCQQDFETKKNEYTNFTSYMCHQLHAFYDFVIINEYHSLGFNAFLYPNTEK